MPTQIVRWPIASKTGVGPLVRLVGARGEHDELPLRGRLLGAEHRAVDEHQAVLPGELRQPPGALDADGRRLQPERALRQAGRRGLDDVHDAVDVPEHGEDDVGALHGLRRIALDGRHVGEGLRRFGGAVPHAQVEPRAGDPAGHAAAHRSGAQECHGRHDAQPAAPRPTRSSGARRWARR